MNLSHVLIWSFSFSVFYPLGLYDFVYHKKDRSLWKCHIMICNMVAGGTVVLFLFCPIPMGFKGMLVAWKGILIFVSRKFWKDPFQPRVLWFIPIAIGAGMLSQFFTLLPWAGFPKSGIQLSLIILICYLLFKGVNRAYVQFFTN